MEQEGFRILVVEEDEAHAAWLRGFLGKDELTRDVTCERSIEDAEARLGDGGVDLVVLDPGFEGCGGMDVFRRLRSRHPGTPIVILTGNGEEEDAAAAVAEGAEDYLIKGENTGHQLSRTIKHTLERAQRRRADESLQLTAQQLRIAREIQFNLYPIVPPMVDGFEVAGRCFLAEEVGGDYFDYLELPDGNWAIVVADAAGHGLGPALMMAQLNACLNTLALTTSDIGEILEKANAVLGPRMPGNRFITMMMLKIDAKAGVLRYGSAGHCPGYVMDGFGEMKAVLSSTQVPLGVSRGVKFPMGEAVKVESGDVVLMMTDGVFEASDGRGQLLGMERVVEYLRESRSGSADEIADGLYERIEAFSPDSTVGGLQNDVATVEDAGSDDVTMVVVKVL